MSDSLSAATKAKYSKPNVYRGFIARFPRAILAVTEVSEYGTVKHELPLEDVSFTEIPDAKVVFIEAECRHMIKEAIEGPVNYEDGGMLHKAQKAWDALADLEIFLKQQEDRKAYQHAQASVAVDMAVREGAGHAFTPTALPKYEDQAYPNLSKDAFVPHVCGVSTSNHRTMNDKVSDKS